MPVPPRSPEPHRRPPATIGRRLAALALVALVLVPAFGPPAAHAAQNGPAGAGPEMDARAMLAGHARIGSWMAIEVRLRNAGPSIVGELRVTGGIQGTTRFSTPVELGTPADQVYRLYAQPPAFGSRIEIALVDGDGRTLSEDTVDVTPHDANQLVVGIVAERVEGILPRLDLPPSPNGNNAALVPLAATDLPDRVEAWATLDHLVWQDVDTTRLTSEQLDGLRGWLAAGGRLVVAGGPAGPAPLGGLPDEILPYRPAATVDVPADAFAGLLGQVPADAADVPAIAGELVRGQALLRVSDRAVAAEAEYGNGAVTILGFDPGAGWLADLPAIESLWRSLLPERTMSVAIGGDDGQIVQAVSQLPSLALPPTSGLLALLLGYIALIGPANYLVLRRLDRREWAWITMPVLIVVFAAGAYAYGAVLRGLDVIVNEVAIVRGAPGTTEGSAQVFLGVFSPTRGTYQLEVPGGALLSSTIAGEFGGGAGALDIVQGDPARVRNLTVGFGALRTLRAAIATEAPLVSADLRLVGDRLEGRLTNRSQVTLERPALVLRSSVAVLDDLGPGESADVSLLVRGQPFGQPLADRIFGQPFFPVPSGSNDEMQRRIVRHGILSQLTFDPMWGMTSSLSSDVPVLLAWGSREVLDVRIEGQVPRRTGNVLYYVPFPIEVSGQAAFTGELIRSTVVDVDAVFFGRDPFSLIFGPGSVTMSYRPIPFDGTLEPSRLLLSLGDGGPIGPARPEPVEPLPAETAPAVEPAQPCDPNTRNCFGDGIPEIELFDRTGDGSWVRLPHFEHGRVYGVADAERYVEAATGGVLVRFVNDRQEQVGVQFQVRIEGVVR